jgi:hypothetical protein
MARTLGCISIKRRLVGLHICKIDVSLTLVIAPGEWDMAALCPIGQRLASEQGKILQHSPYIYPSAVVRILGFRRRSVKVRVGINQPVS